MKWIYLSMILLLAACVPVTGEEPVEPAPEINLEGTQWMLESINETPVVPGSDVTLQFDNDNTAGGHAGCNSYGGTYALNNGDIVFSDIIRTLVACVDENIMDQEDTYLQALENAGQVIQDGDRLTITYNGGQLNFVRAQQ
jgi:heat shock protein HslJ